MNRSNGDATDGAMSWGEWMVKHNYLRVGNGGTGMVGENGARRAMSGANSIGWARINRLESDEEITISALRSRQCRGPWGDAAAPNFEIGISASPTQTRDRTVPCEVRFRVMVFWMIKHNYLWVGNGGTGMVGENGARRAGNHPIRRPISSTL